MPVTASLREQLTTAGGEWEAFGDRTDVASFGNVDAEYAAMHQAVGLVVLVDRTQVVLTGRDRATFLHSFCTNDIRGLSPGQGREAFVCNVQGKMLGHVLVFCQDDALLLETVPGQAERLIKHLDRYLIREQVELHDRSRDKSELLLAGPQSEELLGRLGVATLPAERLSHSSAMLAGCDVQVCRVDMVRPPAILLSMGCADAATVWKALADAGAKPCGQGAFEAARIEADWPWYGQDITDENLPQEIARDAQAISFTKGCYLGQETVARIDALGHVNKLLCGVRFDGAAPPELGTPLSAGGKEIGRVTSAAWSPRSSTVVALAFLRRGSHQPGQRLESAVGTGEVV